MTTSPPSVQPAAANGRWTDPVGLAGAVHRPSTAPPATAVDDLLDRTRRWPLAAVVAMRLVAVVGGLPVLLHEEGLAAVLPLLAVGVEILAVNAVALAALVRHTDIDPARVMRWMLADGVLATGLVLGCPLLLPGQLALGRLDVGLTYLLGAVLLWTAWWGPRVGSILVAVSVPVQLAMPSIYGMPFEGVPYAVLDRTLLLVLGLVAAWVVVALLRLATGVALTEGLRAGREAEQARTLRATHDTVLQSIEGIRLIGTEQTSSLAERVALMVDAAARTADQLRRELMGSRLPVPAPPPPAGPDSLADVIGPVVEQLQRAGVQVEADLRDVARIEVAPAAAEAVQLAAREALVNVLRHARATRASVTALSMPGRLEVRVRDDGVGFDSDRAGFGITQSMRGRLREAGGDVVIHSREGAGTTVRMWVPRGT